MGRGRVLGRDKETWRLDEAWRRSAAGEAQLVSIAGNRRVGKTHLVSRFAADKPLIWFGASQEADAVELARLARVIRTQLGPGVEHVTGEAFASWHSALSFLGVVAARNPLLVVIDDLGALVRGCPGFVDTVRSFWRSLPPGTRLMLVLIGSVRAEALLGPGAGDPPRWDPIRLPLEPLDAARARAFIPELRAPAFLEAYAACGGYPLHLSQWRPEETFDENLLRLAGTTGGILMDHAEALVRDALPETGGYMRILAAIGRNQTRYSEIALAADQRIDHPLDVLVRSGLVRRSVPVGSSPSGASAEYEIADTYLGFWFRVLYPRLAEVVAGQGAAALRRARFTWDRHVANTFQEVARAHTASLRARGELPPDLVVGRWWSPAVKESLIDVLGLHDGQSLLIGEARWSDRPLTLADLAALNRHMQHAPNPAEKPLFAMWGACGVDPEVRRHAMGFDVAAALVR